MTDITTTEAKAIATSAPLTIPTAPRKIDFNLLELSDRITTATGNVTIASNIAECLKRQRRALLSDESYDSQDKNKHTVYGPQGTLTTAREFLSIWESGLIYVEERRHPDMRDLGGVEVLRFNPDHSGQTFNVPHAYDYTMGAPVFAAIKLALDHGWRGETEQVITNRLRAARERLEILRESLPSAETIAGVETYVLAVYQSLSARVESIRAPLADALASPLAFTTPLDFSILSPIAGINADLDNVKGIARRWMLTIDDGGIAASLASMREQMADVVKALQSRAEEIETQAKRLGR